MINDALQFDHQNHLYVLKCAKSIYLINPDDITSPLGNGSYGKVYKAIRYDQQNQQSYAIKQISKSSGLPIQKIEDELQISKQLDQKFNLVSSVDYVVDSKYYYIVMYNYDCGNLSRIINNNEIKDEVAAIEYLRQICYGLYSLHMDKIIHRDLKTDNILATKNQDSEYPYPYYLSISDFGLSKVLQDNSMGNTLKVGTGLTMAPEVSSGNYSFKADVYSIGCIFYKMITCKELFAGVSNEFEKTKILKEPIKVIAKWGKPLSKMSLEILEGCLQSKPENRLDIVGLHGLLQLDSLYTNYHVTELNAVDPSQIIYFDYYSRKNGIPPVTNASNAPIKYKYKITKNKCNINIASLKRVTKSINKVSLKSDIKVKKMCNVVYQFINTDKIRAIKPDRKEKPILNSSIAPKINYIELSKIAAYNLDEVVKACPKISNSSNSMMNENLTSLHNNLKELSTGTLFKDQSNVMPVVICIQKLTDSNINILNACKVTHKGQADAEKTLNIIVTIIKSGFHLLSKLSNAISNELNKDNFKELIQPEENSINGKAMPIHSKNTENSKKQATSKKK